MSIREWCARTNNVFYGATMFTIYRKGKEPIRAVAGCIPDEIAKQLVEWVTVKKINPDTLVFLEVEVKICD